MAYPIETGHVWDVGDDALAAVQWAVRTRDDGPSLALSFDPGAVDDLPLMMRGADLVMGLLGLRGWRAPVSDLRVDVATDTDELAPTRGDVTRLRLVLEGERGFDMGDGATFTPSA